MPIKLCQKRETERQGERERRKERKRKTKGKKEIIKIRSILKTERKSCLWIYWFDCDCMLKRICHGFHVRAVVSTSPAHCVRSRSTAWLLQY